MSEDPVERAGDPSLLERGGQHPRVVELAARAGTHEAPQLLLASPVTLRGLRARLAGLCDEGEEHVFRHGLARAGLHPGPAGRDLERLGFYVCVADLEDEMIRSLGTAAVERLIAGQGELASFRTFCRQPAQRDRTREQQLRRFLGTRSGRKAHYGRVLAEALDLTQVPRPLGRVLAYV